MRVCVEQADEHNAHTVFASVGPREGSRGLTAGQRLITFCAGQT